MPDGLLAALPPLRTVKMEPHDWPSYIPYRIRVGTFHDPSDGAENLPVWAYLHINDNGRTPVTLELGSHVDLGGDDEMNWELYYDNIRHDADGDEPVHLCKPFNMERSRSDLVALVKYYSLLAADAGMFKNKHIIFNESFGQSMRAICRRISKLPNSRVGRGRRKSLSAFPPESLEPEVKSELVSSDSESEAESNNEEQSLKRRLSDMSSNSTESNCTEPQRRPRGRVQLRRSARYTATPEYEEVFSSSTGSEASWDNGETTAVHNLRKTPTSTRKPAQPKPEEPAWKPGCSRFPTLADLKNYNEDLSSEISYLRTRLADKEAQKRELDAELFGHLSRCRNL
jgi:hypothetical protein